MISHRFLAGSAVVAASMLAVWIGLAPASAGQQTTPETTPETTQQTTQETAQSEPLAVAGAELLAASLGDASGGYFLDHGRAVVNVLDSAAARTIQSAGLTARTVKYSLATLTQTKDALDNLHDVPQTAWGIDPSTDQVVVTIYSAASDATANAVSTAAERYGDQVRIEHRAGRLELRIDDGDVLDNGFARCSLGFNVTKNGRPYMLTAGHCTTLGGTWFGDDVSGAQVAATNFPGADEGLLTRPDGTGPGMTTTGQRITSAGTPTVGEDIEKDGFTTGPGSGVVISIDQSVNYSGTVIRHEFGTTAHTDEGDSGGPAYDGSTGLGTLSGGDQETSFYYPLTRELQDFGLSLAH